jgi:hypothetical protein
VVGLAVIVAAYFAMQALGGAESMAVVLLVLLVGFGGTLAVLNLIGPWVLRVMATQQAGRARTATRLIAARSILESPKAAWRQVSAVSMTSFIAVFAGAALALLDMAGDEPETLARLTDARTGVIILIGGTFLMVACSAGVNQAAALLDRRDLYVSLDRIGMSVKEMNAARTRAILSPLRITTIGSAVTAAVVLFPLVGISLIVAPVSLLVIAGCLVAGIFLVWLALLVTRPVLKRLLADPDPVL